MGRAINRLRDPFPFYMRRGAERLILRLRVIDIFATVAAVISRIPEVVALF